MSRSGSNKARYAIGIDLGTSNCALAWVDLRSGDVEPKLLSVPQWFETDRTGESPFLPSFAWLTEPEVLTRLNSLSGARDRECVVGRIAREYFGQVPGRVVRSAKSWLCHSGVNREQKLLPFGSTAIPPAQRLSPVEASAAFLSHLKQAWDAGPGAQGKDHQFDRQVVVITVPASFDASAQRLTRQAAVMAGFPETVRLVEEPQAAFIAWLEAHQDQPVFDGKSGDGRTRRVLVCDIGGGTSDFSLFEYDGEATLQDGEGRGLPVFERVDVSDHILLGGDNIDLAIAHQLEQAMGGTGELGVDDWNLLLGSARTIKEEALSGNGSENDDPDRAYRVATGGGSGSSLFASSRSTEIRRRALLDLVEEGFFPLCPPGSSPREEGQGLRELGLPYASDTAITRHLSGFLKGRRIDAVLFNGGTLKPERLQTRLLKQIASWQGGEMPARLASTRLDEAVAIGAAAYGRRALLSGQGLIRAGAAHGIYLEIEAGKKEDVRHVVCLLPKGSMPGERHQPEKLPLKMRINEPVVMRTFQNRLRPRDHAGQVLRLKDKEFHPLPNLETVMRLDPGRFKGRPNQRIPVRLEAELTELGWLEMALVSRHPDIRPPETWQLEFNLRQAGGEAGEGRDPSAENEFEPLDENLAVEADRLLGGKFGPGLLKELETIIGQSRSQWNPRWLRRFWTPLGERITSRHLSPEYEVAWLNAAGYFLRPGIGVALDDERIRTLWALQSLELAHPAGKQNREQYYILWRRVSAGLSAEQQKILVGESWDRITSGTKQAAEAVRMAGSFELLDHKVKAGLKDHLLEHILARSDRHCEPWIWALGRILSRCPFHAGEAAVVPDAWVLEAFERLQGLPWESKTLQPLGQAFIWAARRTGHRAVDLKTGPREAILEKLAASGLPEEALLPLREVVPLQRKDVQLQFGEALPPGLQLD